MPEYLSPGIYVEEVERGAKPIQGAGTAMAAFIGFAASGPCDQPVLVTNWSQFVETFGALDESGRRQPHIDGAYLSHSVYAYFANGGGRCYVSRIAPAVMPTAIARLAIPSATSEGSTALSLSRRGELTSDLEIQISGVSPKAPKDGPAVFSVKLRAGDIEETYEKVSMAPDDAQYVVTLLNEKSSLVQLEVPTKSSARGKKVPDAALPKAGTYVLRLSQAAQLPQVNFNQFIGDVAARSGAQGLEVADDVTMVCCPDLMSAFESGALDRDGVKAVQLAILNHCERMGDRFAILDALPGLTPQQVANWRLHEAGYDSKYGGLYYPWIEVMGPDGKPMRMPPSGHIAGIYARSDAERGVHKAPANEIVRGALRTTLQITKGEQDTLNPIGVNCIRSFTGRGLRVWGARTLSSDPAWRYINVRRLFSYVERSIEIGTQWIVFEPNTPDLWARVKRDVGAFLTNVWRDGMLFGRTPSEAFYVKCDEELNPPEVRDLGQLVIEVGLAPVKPAEFVIFRMSQWSGGGP